MPACGRYALDAACLQHFARIKRPRRSEFVGELPKNDDGKVLERKLRETFKEATWC